MKTVRTEELKWAAVSDEIKKNGRKHKTHGAQGGHTFRLHATASVQCIMYTANLCGGSFSYILSAALRPYDWLPSTALHKKFISRRVWKAAVGDIGHTAATLLTTKQLKAAAKNTTFKEGISKKKKKKP